MSWAGAATGLGEGLMAWGKQKIAKDAKQAEQEWKEKMEKMNSQEDQFNSALEAVVEAERAKGNDDKAVELEKQARFLYNRDQEKAWALVGVSAKNVAEDREALDSKFTEVEATPREQEETEWKPGLLDFGTDNDIGKMRFSADDPDVKKRREIRTQDQPGNAERAPVNATPNPAGEGMKGQGTTKESPLVFDVDPNDQQLADKIRSLPEGTYVKDSRTGRLGVIKAGYIVPVR